MFWRFKKPTPAFVIAMIALFVALGGTAGAVAGAVAPLAKRALVADNAKKFSGLTPTQYGAVVLKASQSLPGPASTAAGLVTTNTAPFSVAGGAEQIVGASCGAGGKALGGGFINPTQALVVSASSAPTSDGSGWNEDLINLSDTTAASGTVVVTCIK